MQQNILLWYNIIVIATFMSYSLFVGIGQAARDGRSVHSHEPDSPAPQEVWPGPAWEDQGPVRGSSGPMEQPQDQGVPGQTEAGS